MSVVDFLTAEVHHRYNPEEPSVPVTINDEQLAARELVRDWAAAAGAAEAIRAVELGETDAWKPVFARLADLGLFGVAVAEECGGAGGRLEDLCAMVDEAAKALVPGPVATTALATLVVADPQLAEALAGGERVAGVAIDAELDFDAATAKVSGTAERVLGATADALLVLPAGQNWVLVDARADGVTVEPLTATDFSRPLAKVTLTAAPAAVLEAGSRVENLAVTVLSAEAAGVARWALDTAVAYAKVREQFGKPIGSFQAVKHLCAEMLCRAEQAAVAASDVARAAADPDDQQFAIAAAVAAAICIDAAKANAKDCIQVLGGIGITWEHDAHLYLRRAYGIGQALGGTQRWLRRTATLTRAGVRRRLEVDLEQAGQDDAAGDVRPEIAAEAARIAALPDEQRQVALAESGLLAPHWPAPYGRGAGPAEQLVIDQELAAAGVGRPDLVIGWWAAPTILEHGTPEQIERFIPATLTGEVFWCQLFSEPGAGSDLAALRTKAVKVDGGWRLTGQKVWTSRADDSQWGICLARTDPSAPKHKGITYFLLDMTAEGIDIRPLREITGDALFNEVFLDDVFVPDEMVVGAVNDGWRLARTTLANERVAIAGGTALGNPMEELLKALFGGEGDRETDTATAERLARLILAAQAGSLLDQRIAQLAVGGQDPGSESSVRKLIGVRYRQQLAEYRMDVTDGAGAVAGREVHDFLNTRCLSIAGGTEQILLTLAAERLLGLPRG